MGVLLLLTSPPSNLRVVGGGSAAGPSHSLGPCQMSDLSLQSGPKRTLIRSDRLPVCRSIPTATDIATLCCESAGNRSPCQDDTVSAAGGAGGLTLALALIGR